MSIALSANSTRITLKITSIFIHRYKYSKEQRPLPTATQGHDGEQLGGLALCQLETLHWDSLKF